MYIIHTLQCSRTVIVTVCLGLDEFEYTTLKLVSLYPTVYRSNFNQELCCYVPLASQLVGIRILYSQTVSEEEALSR